MEVNWLWTNNLNQAKNNKQAIQSMKQIFIFSCPCRTRTELMESIKSYKPTVSSVSQIRVLLIGPIGAGKSSFFNSINSVFRGHVTSQAISGSSTTSLTTQVSSWHFMICVWGDWHVTIFWFVFSSLCTTQFRSYSLKAGREGKPLPIILCDTMGLEESTGSGLDIDDISNILKGHLPDRYQVHHFVTWSRILNV